VNHLSPQTHRDPVRHSAPAAIVALAAVALLTFSLVGCAGSKATVQGEAAPDNRTTAASVIPREPGASRETDTTGLDPRFLAAVDSLRNADSSAAHSRYLSPRSTVETGDSAFTPADTAALNPRFLEAVDSLRSTDSTIARSRYFAPVGKQGDLDTSATKLQRPVFADSTSRAWADSARRAGLARLQPISIDSVRGDSLQADTTKAKEKEESDLDTSIVYGGDEIRFDVAKRSSVMLGRAKIVYKDMTLTAHKIVVDWENNLMTATPELDTLYTDSTNSVIDSVVIKGMPTFVQGGQTMTGMLMRVNMKNREGYVEEGRTEYGDGFYVGKDIQKVSDEVLYVHDGAFTTCDLPNPHYKFTGSEMKMIYKDKVVGKPVVMRFGDVPVFALPFGVFSVKPGRHSGVLVPTYGDDSRRGRHLRNLGYYWAASEYWDLQSTLDFYEKAGVLLRSSLAYKKRYMMDGGVSGSYSDQSVSGNRSTSWDLRVRHNQDIDQYTKLRVDGNFISGENHSQEYYDNPAQRLKQDIRSNATLTKSWPSSGASMSLNLSHQQNLVTKQNSQTLPRFTFRLGTKNLFPSEQKKKSADKNLLYAPPEARQKPGSVKKEKVEEKWYNQITWSYSNEFKNLRKESRDGSPTDLSLPLKETYQTGLTHNLSTNAPQRLFKYFNLTPSIRFTEDWFNERRSWYVDDNGQAKSVQERGFFARHTFSSSMNLNTKLYGFFPINHWSVEAVRHVMTPSMSFTYRPDFSDPEWGYYQTFQRSFQDSTGTETVSYKRDRYDGGVLGGTARGKSLSLGMSLGNLFQMKRIKVNEKGDEEEIKNELFTYNLSTSYNFAADSLRFSRMSSSFRADPINGKNAIGPLERVNIQFSTTHSFYQYDPEAKREVNKFYWDQPGHGLNVIRMTRFETSSTFSMSGSNPFVRQRQAPPTAPVDTVATDTTGEDLGDIRNDLEQRFKDPANQVQKMKGGKPWRLQGGIRYQLSMNNPMDPQETIRVNGNLTVQLTKNWQFQYSTTLDLQNRRVVSGDVIIRRDLHCWEGSFRWSPQGIGQGFYLRIGIKAPQLRDIKLEQQRGRGALNF